MARNGTEVRISNKALEIRNRSCWLAYRKDPPETVRPAHLATVEKPDKGQEMASHAAREAGCAERRSELAIIRRFLGATARLQKGSARRSGRQQSVRPPGGDRPLARTKQAAAAGRLSMPQAGDDGDRNLLPAKGAAAHNYNIGLRHGGRLRDVRLGGCGFLQAVQEIRCALGVGCGGEDRALVVFQDLDP
jgi:hypothetical protein